MELKIKYQYSYFIYPYMVKNYKKHIQKLLKDSKCTPKYFARKKNLNVYNYFLPGIRDYMFNSFNFSSKGKNSLDEKLKENLFKSSPCAMFDYNIGNNAQAKTGEEDGIFFKIQKIEIVCFESGICFLAIKTNIEDTDKFSDLLNFNFKFKDINSEVENTGTSNIKIQTDTFEDVKELSELIKEITGSPIPSKKIDIDTNRFLVYSYVCIDQEYWNETREFSEIEKEYLKYANVLNSEFNSSYNNERLKTVNLGKYIKIGISSSGVNLIASSVNTVNYTNLPVDYENEYLYTYLFALSQKFYFAKLMKRFASQKTYMKAKKEFVKFTNDVWVHEVTNEDNGILVYESMRTVLGLERTYDKVKEQYDVMYKNFKVKNSDILNKIILVLLAVSIVTNIINFINLYKLK